MKFTRKRQLWLRLLAILFTFALVAAACGDDDDSGQTVTEDGTADDSSDGSADGSSDGSADDSSDGSADDSSDGSADDSSDGSADDTSDGSADDTSGEPADGEPVAGGTLVFAEATDTASFDPISVGLSVPTDGIENFLVYDALIQVDAEGNVVPRLAESLTTDDSTVYALTLREGLTFTDGTPFDAAAVVFNWDRHTDEANASRCARHFANVASYEATDARTVTITLASANAQFKWDLGECMSVIGSPAAIQEKGEAYGLEPVGAGPFILESWTQGTEQRYVKNPDFWDAPKPYVDEVVLTHQQDAAQRTTAFTEGEADMIFFNIASGSIADLEDAGFNTLTTGFQGGTGWFFNLNRAPMDDVRVRQALALATDLDEANDVAANGGAVPAYEYFSRGTAWHRGDSEIPNPVNDFDAAQALIDEVVAETGEIEFTITTSTGIKAWAESLQQQWSELDGVTVNFEELDGAEMLQRNLSGETTTGPWAWHGPDPHGALESRLVTGGGLNVMQYSNADVDALLAQGKASTDFAEREDIYHQVMQIVLPEMPLLTLYHTSFPTYTHDYVQGLTIFPTGMPDLTGVWLDR